MKRSQALYRLQVVDLEIESKRRRLGEVEASLGESEELLEARRSLQEEERSLEGLRKKLRLLDLDLKGLSNKIASLEGRLYSGQVKNPKELAGMQQEVQYLKRKRAALEEETLEVMIGVEEGEAAVAAEEKRLKRIEAAWNQEQARLRDEQADLSARLADLERRREELRGLIAEDDMSLYEELRRKKGGRGVALLKEGICQGCGVALPSSRAQQVRWGHDLIFCSSCGRILYAEK